MLIIPELQIEGGRLVTRVGPDVENIVHSTAPKEAAAKLVREGAERLHILDVDAALGREENNEALIREIITETSMPVQVAGGMRTASQIEAWFEAGAAHVVLGTLAITNQQLIAEVSGRYPAGVLANLATKDGFVMIDGWRTQTAFRPEDIVYDLQMAGVAGIIHFDINRRDTDSSTSLALTMEMKSNVAIPVYSSGTVSNVGDLSKVGHLPNIEGVIVGEALLNGTFTLLEAQEVAATAERERDHDLDSPSTIQHMQSGVNIYLAAYNLSAAAQWWNEELRRAIAADNPYVEVFIPQSDIDTAQGDLTPRERQAAYEKAIEQADAVLVVLDGVENESWTGFECGYTRALGKYLLGIATGPYNPQRERFEAMCDDVVQVIADGENPGDVLATIAKEVNSRLLSDW